MLEITKPDSLDGNQFSAAVRRISAAAVRGVERRHKGQPGDTYVCFWDETVAPVPTDSELIDASHEWGRSRKITEALDEASRRRQAVLDAITPGGLADYVSLMGRALAGVRREAKGRAKQGEADRLDALEALSDQIEAIDTARDTIIAEIGQHPDSASYDVPGSPHWP